jgi:hypothetical protein
VTGESDMSIDVVGAAVEDIRKAAMREALGVKARADEEVLAAAKPNMVITFMDTEGREWLAAGYLGTMTRFEAGFVTETLAPERAEEREFRVADVKVVSFD